MMTLQCCHQGRTKTELGSGRELAAHCESDTFHEFNISKYIAQGGLKAYPIIEGMVTSACLESQRRGRKRHRESRTDMDISLCRRGEHNTLSHRQQMLVARARFTIGSSGVCAIGEELGFNISDSTRRKGGPKMSILGDLDAKLPVHKLAARAPELKLNFDKIARITIATNPGGWKNIAPLVHCMDETYLNAFLHLCRAHDGSLKAFGGEFSYDVLKDRSILVPDQAIGVEGSPYLFSIVSKVLDDYDGFQSASWPWSPRACSGENFVIVVGELIKAGNQSEDARTKDIATDCPSSWIR